MPYTDTDTNADDREYPRLTRAVEWLIALNVAVYFLQVTIVNAGACSLRHRSGSLPAWWTVVSYMFVHGGFWHVALNMYTLFLFGPRLEHAWSAREFRNFYLWCGMGGLILHLLVVRESVLIGASAAVLGVTLAYAMRWPDDEVLLFFAVPLKVKWLVALLVVVNVMGGLAMKTRGGGVAYLAHLGGLATAWVILRTSAGGGIDRLRQRVSPVPDVLDEPPRAVPRSLPRSRERARDIDEIVSQSNQALSRHGAPTAPAHGPLRDAPRPTDLDRVLDKISEQGIENLTMDERRLLEERSRELRKGD